jgi:hypothetical protein
MAAAGTDDRRVVDHHSRAGMDGCLQLTRDVANQQHAGYVLSNLAPTAGVRPEAVRAAARAVTAVATDNARGFRDGAGYLHVAHVDEDSRLRVDAQVTRWRERQSLQPRIFHDAPDLAGGALYPGTESYLQQGDVSVGRRRQCSGPRPLAEHMPERFPALLPEQIAHAHDPRRVAPSWGPLGGAQTRGQDGAVRKH